MECVKSEAYLYFFWASETVQGSFERLNERYSILNDDKVDVKWTAFHNYSDLEKKSIDVRLGTKMWRLFSTRVWSIDVINSDTIGVWAHRK